MYFRTGSMVLKKASRSTANDDSVLRGISAGDSAMMGQQTGDQTLLVQPRRAHPSAFNLEERIPARSTSKSASQRAISCAGSIRL
jgi:hypothetical protein